MPEYLSPAVYVEEVDTGSKPIEGVSTSTAGMIGVAERGPAHVPILVTSYGEYQRWFGQGLNAAVYGEHRFLPHGVEGFFINGGKRVYVTRVLEIDQALPANRQLVAPDLAAPLSARLIVPSAPTETTITIDADPGFLVGNTLQLGEGISAEFDDVAAPAVAANTVTLHLPLSFDHASPQAVDQLPITDAAPPASHSSSLASPTAIGATSVLLGAGAFAPAITAGDVFRIDTGDLEELVVAAGPVAGNRLNLRAPLLLAHAAAAQLRRQAIGAVAAARQVAPGAGVAPGSAVVLVNSNAGLTTPGDGVRFAHPDPARVEYRRIGALTRLTLSQPAYADYPVGTRVSEVTLGAASAATTLGANAAPGATTIAVLDRTTMNVGDMLEIGTLGDTEFVEIVALPARLPAPDAGNVVLRAPLRVQHLSGASVARRAPPTAATLNTVVALAAAVGSPDVVVALGGYAASDALRIEPLAGGPFYHVVAGAPAAVTPQTLTLVNPLTQPHGAGALVARRNPMILVRALDAGAWGNRLRVAMEAMNPPQDAPLLTTRVRQVLPGNRLRLNSAAGVETGSELLVTDSTNTTTPLKVLSIDRQNDFLITLEASTPLPGIVVAGDAVRSREYRLVVELLRQPDAAYPARDTTAIDREVFAGLSLDPRHSRYFQRVVGTTWNMTTTATTFDDAGRPLRRADRRSEGESDYIRVLDVAPSTGVRPGPVATYDVRPGVPPRLVLLPLGNGTDMVPGITDATYIGTDSVDPEQRTGLFTLRNVEEISIVAAPGRTNVQMQSALINHCELMRYRFVALDGAPPPADSMSDIQAQRQQFDTKYAALYHPWLLIPDPYPTNLAAVADYPIPPSGHVLGIFARTDIERGVHKAPANEVVRGVVGLQRLLNKEQHDILNPYPVNINVIRDFRPNNRGIRVYGGRVITSDSDWKYVNVRRLLIFIEASIDRGLQWVVFEPNAEPLWARVRRAISNFLTLVWRNGGLEGTKVEEAYFVKCDRTTMTQTDIDQGRLIVLVGVAPVKPAEFVIVRIGLWTAHAED
ncbi:phage tail sheath C-terminal domain-containing protein [Aromatoleum buckelii]|uniref:Phage tail sheath protein n=1 Tax=Aromatoleum buckelii TaxID=200254 RepID=A0ABX1N4Y6_9RHOO|nr:phage tail sheath C-terminal domain-containing protein [Aromatoleum buckelii]MCK0509727.1 phage tail sheath subtilisin-like domain-containing protein [Aromatoleum buckelii]